MHALHLLTIALYILHPASSFLQTPRQRASVLHTRRSTISSTTTTTQRYEASGDFFDEISNSLGDTSGTQEDMNVQEDAVPPMTDEELRAALTEWDNRVPKLNTVNLVGRVGNDPDPRYFDDGKVVLNLSLAVKRKYHPLERKARNIQSGEEETDWFPLEIWGRDAEFASKYVDKGCRIGVTGSMNIDSWTDKATGEFRERAKIIVKHLDILESRAEGDLRRQNRRGPSFYMGDDDDDDESNDGSGPGSAGSGGFFD
eukprot:CAMPEP_0195257550 /NCGR_PEP_ID=MMETSP0706-20130129/6883_1 /TAXON_ID=33640 /ORGANISM="Asterionellopsis glacialis, Strain CCMP134" /LENGTH=256 /DNA_ID=CAMNT_0040310775 /DNA_START=8 /DNA_END=778 /DNA_ORIENTATION=-